MITSRKIRWAWHVVRMKMKNASNLWLGNLKGRHNLENLRVDGMIKLIKELRKVEWVGFDWLLLAQERKRWRGFCKYDNNLLVP
jgi:hypothetical protein